MLLKPLLEVRARSTALLDSLRRRLPVATEHHDICQLVVVEPDAGMGVGARQFETRLREFGLRLRKRVLCAKRKVEQQPSSELQVMEPLDRRMRCISIDNGVCEMQPQRR